MFLLIRKLNFQIKCSEIEGVRGNRGIPVYPQGKIVIATGYQMSILNNIGLILLDLFPLIGFITIFADLVAIESAVDYHLSFTETFNVNAAHICLGKVSQNGLVIVTLYSQIHPLIKLMMFFRKELFLLNRIDNKLSQ